jgi:hypothetical protein
MRRRKLVVVGNGMAGARLVEDLLARGGGDLFELVVFGDEPYGNYNRILLSNVLAQGLDDQDIFINPLDWYARNRVRLHAGTPVHGIDRRSRRLFYGDGGEERYDTLVFATGSTAFVPPFEGLRSEDGGFKPGVLVFRTLDDCHAIRAAADHVGAGDIILIELHRPGPRFFDPARCLAGSATLSSVSATQSLMRPSTAPSMKGSASPSWRPWPVAAQPWLGAAGKTTRLPATMLFPSNQWTRGRLCITSQRSKTPS